MRRKDPNKPPKRFKSYRVSYELYERAEAYAKIHLARTGEYVLWTDIVRAVLIAYLPKAK
jgi:hypothetical protein